MNLSLQRRVWPLGLDKPNFEYQLCHLPLCGSDSIIKPCRASNPSLEPINDTLRMLEKQQVTEWAALNLLR